MTNAEIFRKAADYIREHGWRKGAMGEMGGPRCVSGAIRAACGIDIRIGEAHLVGGRWNEEGIEAMRLASERVRSLLSPAGRQVADAIVLWNDTICHNGEELIALLDSLADDEELKDQIASLPPAVKEPISVG